MGRKIIVAVHGIGDQFYFETLQTVAKRVYEYYDRSNGYTISLGRLNSVLKIPRVEKTQAEQKADEKKKGCYFPGFPDPILPLLPKPTTKPASESTIGFAEVYWADLPRTRLSSGYELEESKRWANGLVQRLRGFDTPDGKPSEIDYDLAAMMLAEMADTIGVLEWLLSFARKMKLFDFKLKKLLDDMLGDVQFVTEFHELREKIMKRFVETMARIQPEDEDEIYLITHSEGTVVSTMGLLTAMVAEATKPGVETAWVKNVRGLVTLGSPVDKHLIIWPDIWEGLDGLDEDGKRRGEALEKLKIKWWNYYDCGDPVGFKLETARDWIAESAWAENFVFTEEQDIGFVRYSMPGKAHVEYWNDQELFDQILHDVVELEPKNPKPEVPKTKKGAQFTSWVLPYVFAFISLGAGMYALNMGVWGFQKLDRFDDYGTFFREVLGFTCLLGGVTVVSRIPLLAKKGSMTLVAVGVFVVLCLLGRSLVPTEIHEKFARLTSLEALEDWFFPGVAALTALGAWILNKRHPGWGMKPLFLAGGVAVFALVGLILWKTSSADPKKWEAWEVRQYEWELNHPATKEKVEIASADLPPLPPGGEKKYWREVVQKWSDERSVAAATGRPAPPRPAAMPEHGSVIGVVLGLLAFFYLWRLSALLFDLTFVWHRYIQGGAMTDVLHRRYKKA